jgi:hypothetical protein
LRQRSWLRRTSRSPLVHFGILGTLLFLLAPSFAPKPDRVIRVATSDLATDQDLDERAALADPGLVLLRAAPQSVNVEPGAHHLALIEADRSGGGMRKDESESDPVQVQFGDDRNEIVAVRAEAMEPDHAGDDRFSRFVLDRFESLFRRH